MQIDTVELLLEDFRKYLDKKAMIVTIPPRVVGEYLATESFNNIAFAKPEPLAKNKQTESKCDHEYIYQRHFNLRFKTCIKCEISHFIG